MPLLRAWKTLNMNEVLPHDMLQSCILIPTGVYGSVTTLIFNNSRFARSLVT